MSIHRYLSRPPDGRVLLGFGCVDMLAGVCADLRDVEGLGWG